MAESEQNGEDLMAFWLQASNVRNGGMFYTKCYCTFKKGTAHHVESLPLYSDLPWTIIRASWEPCLCLRAEGDLLFHFQWHANMHRHAILKPASIPSKVKQTLSPTLLVGMQISTATMDKSLEVPWKTKSRTIIRLGIDQTKPSFKDIHACPMSFGSLAGRGVWGTIVTCVCISLSPFAVHLKLSWHC